MLAFLLACADPIPEECISMCSSAASLYGDCLESWGAGWPQAGYEDQADFLARCEVWAWEMQLLQEDAGESGQVEGLCRQRQELFSSADATCNDYTTVDWSETPW